MKKLLFALVALVALVAIYLVARPDRESTAPAQVTLRVGLAPYQDLAMIVNAKPLGLEKRYGTNLELVTMGWEDILPSVATAGRGVDVGFGSYAEYLTKFNNINSAGADPVLFVYPLYVFKGGAFVTFRPDVPQLTQQGLADRQTVSRILALKIGAQRKSVYEMMLYELAARNGIPASQVKPIDTPLDQGFLAAQQGSLDLASAGLTQLTETQRRNGHVVFTMDDLRFADFTGLIVKKSVYDARRKDIANLIRMWFDCVDYVYRDIDHNSANSLAYLNRQASTRYTLDEYKKALSQEYLPRTLAESQAQFIDSKGRYPVSLIKPALLRYLQTQNVPVDSARVADFITP